MKVDVWGHENKYKNWKKYVKEHGEIGLTKKNSDILIKYIFDMEIGANVSKVSKKGPRSYPRLNNLRQRLAWIMRKLQKRSITDITKIREEQIIKFFDDMRKGVIKRQDGKNYKSVTDYIMIFKAFWNWYRKVNRKKGTMIPDITEDLAKDKYDPSFVYVTKEDLEKMLPYFTEDEQVVLMFTFDSIIRAPTELLSLQVKDIFKKDGCVWVNISKEIAKTLGRSLNLLYCGDAVLEYIERNDLKSEDQLFKFSPLMFNKKMQKVAAQIFKNKISHPTAGGYYKDMTLYDLRHSGAIHLRILAKKTGRISLDAIRQRGGWTGFDMLNYYTKFIGLDGNIDKNATLIEEDKTKLEKEINMLREKYDKLVNVIKTLDRLGAKNLKNLS